MGGLSRRLTKIHEHTSETNWLVVESANFAWKSNQIIEAKLPQQRRKVEFILDTFGQLGIAAVGLGEGESALGMSWVVHSAKDRNVPVIASTMKCDGLEIPMVAFHNINDLTVGIMSVVREAASIEGCQITPVEQSVKDIQAQHSNTDIWIVLSMLSEAEQLTLTESVSGIDFLIDGYTKALLDKPKPLSNDSLRLSVGSRGKYFGVLDVHTENADLGHQLHETLDYFEGEVKRIEGRLETIKKIQSSDEKAQARQARRLKFFTAELEKAEAALAAHSSKKPTGNTATLLKIGLSKEVADHPATLSDLNMALQDIERLANADSVEPYNGPFVGSSACQSCHSKIYEQWATTAHAHAWTTLINEKRAFDLECFACHSTGAHHPDGPQHPKQLGALVGVGCESCHGPGQDHINAPMANNIQRTAEESLCITCHDGVKDEGRFDFEQYYPKVVHANEDSGD